jgi:hypothetical protein
MAHKAQLELPEILIGQPDIVRLKRELEALRDYLHQAALRKLSKTDLKLPRTSRLLDEIAKLNGLDILQRTDYDWLLTVLTDLQEHGSQVHVAFPTDPSAAFVAKIVAWLRANVHPQLLVQVGLEPNLAAGCVVRTRNRQFDLSLKEHFATARPLLIKKLEAGRPANG